MSEKAGLFVILGNLSITNPKLVLMRGLDYFRIEDLVRWARYDLRVGPPETQALLSEPIYWHTYDERGKILVKGIDQKGIEFVAYAEPGSDVRTDVP